MRYQSVAAALVAGTMALAAPALAKGYNERVDRLIGQAGTDPAFAAQVLASPHSYPLAVFYAAGPSPRQIRAYRAYRDREAGGDDNDMGNEEEMDEEEMMM